MDDELRPQWFKQAMMAEEPMTHEAMMAMADDMEDGEEMGMGHMSMPMGHHHHMQMHGPNLKLAHAYVCWQCYRCAFCPEEALMKGTLFPELWGVYPIPK